MNSLTEDFFKKDNDKVLFLHWAAKLVTFVMFV